MSKIAVVGDRESVLAFRALGVEVFSPHGEKEIRQTLDRLARRDYVLIFLTEAYASQAQETVERYKTKAVPAIILIPDSQGSRGLGMQEISDNVEKAVGMNIF